MAVDFDIEHLTLVVISYEMATSVRFCLSYDPVKPDFIAFKMRFISIRNALLTRTLSMTLPVRAKVLLHVWSYEFMKRRYPLNNSDVI